MLFQRIKRSGTCLLATIAAVGVFLASGCQMNDSANDGTSFIATFVTSLGDFVASFARNFLAAWVL